MRFRFAPVAVLLFASVAAHADSITFTLNNPSQSVTSAGGTLSYNATVSAPSSNTGTEDLNYLVFNLNPVNSFQIDQSGFLNSFPLSLNPGDSYPGLLFTLMVPANSPSNSYFGTVKLYGGPSGNGLLGTQNFGVYVAPAAVAVTPEPSSLLLLGTGMVGAVAAFRRRVVSFSR